MEIVELEIECADQVLCDSFRIASAYICRLGLPAELRSLGDDIIQDAMLVATRKLPQLAILDEESLNRWVRATVFLVARNTTRSEWRRTRMWTRLTSVLIEADFIVCNQFDVDDDLVRMMTNSLIVLSEQDQQLLIGWVWDGLTMAELAVNLNLSEQTARQRLCRARRRSRDSIAEFKNSSALCCSGS